MPGKGKNEVEEIKTEEDEKGREQREDAPYYSQSSI